MTGPSDHAPAAPPSPGDVAWLAASAASKAALIGLALDALLNSDSPRYSGKAMRKTTRLTQRATRLVKSINPP